MAIVVGWFMQPICIHLWWFWGWFMATYNASAAEPLSTPVGGSPNDDRRFPKRRQTWPLSGGFCVLPRQQSRCWSMPRFRWYFDDTEHLLEHLLEHLWIIFGTSLDHLWNIFRRSLEHMIGYWWLIVSWDHINRTSSVTGGTAIRRIQPHRRHRWVIFTGWWTMWYYPIPNKYIYIYI